ncbi:MAG: choline transporter [Alteromonadaceae bacterium]|nr:choline transporter [Alteromonadaceae bacterium]|tara:strand:- start:5387 stop:7015 length:1629 start_codon:yes stop_codon:yes gene_type:complete
MAASRKKRYGNPAKKLFGIAIHRPVFIPAAFLIFTLALSGVLAPQYLGDSAKSLQEAIANNLGWFYLVAMNVFLGFAVYLIFSRYGDVRLGGDNVRPEFSNWGWYSMLFAAGTGVGLLFYGVAEPVSFFGAPPFGEPETEQAARDALVHSYFHWGFHGWSMYALVGLSLGFFCYNRGLPLTVRSAFQPLLGDRLEGPWGNLIDIIAVVGTLTGVAVSLGLGVKQINTGLEQVFGLPNNTGVQLGLIAGITAAATASVVTGLAKGIQLLSKLAMLLGGALVVYVVFFGPAQFLFHALVESIGAYLQQIPSRGTYLEAFKPPGSPDWQNQWTLFYFAWWISWSPFVGMFIARVSLGRTLREYLLGVLLVPTAVSMIWLTSMGGSALYSELYGDSNLVSVLQEDVVMGFFVFLENFDVPHWLSLISMSLLIMVVCIFFVTSSDSGSLVIDILSSGGDTNPPTPTRVFWALLEGTIAAVLLVAGGLVALQSVATIAGLAFAIVILLMCMGLYLGLKRDGARYQKGRQVDGDGPLEAVRRSGPDGRT